jgi:hypothetical protein
MIGGIEVRRRPHVARWEAAGGSPHEVLMAAELQELELGRARDQVSAVANALSLGSARARSDDDLGSATRDTR